MKARLGFSYAYKTAAEFEPGAFPNLYKTAHSESMVDKGITPPLGVAAFKGTHNPRSLAGLRLRVNFCPAS